MFDTLSARLEKIGGRLRGRGRISAQDLAEALGEIRTAMSAEEPLNAVVTLPNQPQSPLTGVDGVVSKPFLLDDLRAARAAVPLPIIRLQRSAPKVNT